MDALIIIIVACLLCLKNAVEPAPVEEEVLVRETRLNPNFYVDENAFMEVANALVLGLVALTQVAQMWICGMSLMTIFLLIPRVLFSLRFVGTMIGLRVLLSLEAVGLGVWIVWRALIIKNFTLPVFIAFLVCELIVCTVYVVDNDMFLYIVDDDE